MTPTGQGQAFALRGVHAGRIPSLLGIASLLAVVAGCAGTGSIQGRIRVPAGQGTSAEAARKGAPGTVRDTMDAVVMAWPKSGPRSARGQARASIVHTGRRFMPRVLVIEPGTTVEFENRDRVFHNAFCISPPRPFDLGKYAPGQTREVRFDEIGIFHVFCEMHPEELAFVVVAPDRWHTRPGPDGRFVLDKVPPGTYLVRAWHPALGNRTYRVEVSKKESAHIDFEP